MSKSHILFNPDIPWLKAYNTLHPSKLRVMTEKSLYEWWKQNIKHPRTLCGEYVNEQDIKLANNPEKATCKVCLKAHKKRRKDTEEMKELGLL